MLIHLKDSRSNTLRCLYLPLCIVQLLYPSTLENAFLKPQWICVCRIATYSVACDWMRVTRSGSWSFFLSSSMGGELQYFVQLWVTIIGCGDGSGLVKQLPNSLRVGKLMPWVAQTPGSNGGLIAISPSQLGPESSILRCCVTHFCSRL